MNKPGSKANTKTGDALPPDTASRRRRDGWFYVSIDWLVGLLVWIVFFLYRRNKEGLPFDTGLFDDPNFYLGALLIPLGWVLFYALFDEYRDIYRLSRLATLARTLLLSFFGVLFLFFTVILDDNVGSYKGYYRSFFTLFGLQFSLTALARMILLTRASRRLKEGTVAFNTLIIGGGKKALELFQDISSRKKGLGNRFVGFLGEPEMGTYAGAVSEVSSHELNDYLPRLGSLDELNKIIPQHNIEEVIIAIETSQHNRLRELLNVLFDYDKSVLVKIIPDMYDIMLGTVKMNHVFGAVLIEIRQN